jgi:hypothetical protein
VSAVRARGREGVLDGLGGVAEIIVVDDGLPGLQLYRLRTAS